MGVKMNTLCVFIMMVAVVNMVSANIPWAAVRDCPTPNFVVADVGGAGASSLEVTTGVADWQTCGIKCFQNMGCVGWEFEDGSCKLFAKITNIVEVTARTVFVGKQSCVKDTSGGGGGGGGGGGSFGFVNTVICDAQGFSPTFEYKVPEAQFIKIEIVLGTDANKKWCTGQSAAAPESVASSVEVTKEDIDSSTTTPKHYKDRIPYQQATDGKDGTAENRCGGKLEHWTDSSGSTSVEKIKYEVTAYAIVTRRFRGKIDRKSKHPFTIRCDLVRDVSTSSDKGFTVATALVEETEGDATTATISYVATLKLYSDSAYSSVATTDLEINNNAPVYFMIEQGANQDLFKYVVDKCTATVGKTNPNPTANLNDVFFDGQCPKDSTVKTDFANIGTDHKFKMETGAFSFTGKESSKVFFHCDLTVCLDTDVTSACTQKADCGASQISDNRRRRSARGSRYQARGVDDGVIGTKTISSEHSILIRAAEILTPSCGPGFIYDRVLKRCSNENLMEIKGIYLGAAAWDPAYANVSSEAFKSMVAAREYQLWVVLQVTQRTSYVHGIQVVRARQGSVILDVLVKHAPTVSAKEAFEQFDEALQTKPSVTRVMDVLQIREGKTIEFVPVIAVGGAETNFDVLILVVVVVLVVIVNIAGVLLFKMRRQRLINNNNNRNAPTGFDNKAVNA